MKNKSIAREVKEQLLTSVEDFIDALVLRDKDGRVTFLNRQAEKIFRVRRGDILGKSAVELTDRASSRLREALAVAVVDSVGVRLVLPEDEGTRVFLVSEMHLSEQDAKTASLRIFRETTRDEELSQLKTKFMSAAAHQLRTPISALKWVLQMLLSGDVGPLRSEQQEFLQRAAKAADQAIRLIADLLDVTRIEEGRFAYDFQLEPNLTKLIEGLIEEVHEQIDTQRVKLTFVPPKSPLPPLFVDASRFTLAVSNVLANAIAYTPQGSIEVSLERRDDTVSIVVHDTGIGIPQDEQDRLFAKFFRGSNVIRLGIDGTGLGLFITRSIIQRHGGEVTISSKEDEGTVVTLTLPIDPQSVPSGEIPLEEITI